MSKYIVNKKGASVNGTNLKGVVETTYDAIVNLFGKPLGGSADGKTTCEWILEFEDGTVATIYDWKTGTTPKELYKWNIGGHTYKVLELLEKVMNIKPTPFVI